MQTHIDRFSLFYVSNGKMKLHILLLISTFFNHLEAEESDLDVQTLKLGELPFLDGQDASPKLVPSLLMQTTMGKCWLTYVGLMFKLARIIQKK